MTTYTRVQVFRSSLGDSTNGGVSAVHWELYIEDPEGEPMRKAPNPKLVFRAEDRGNGYLAMIPVVRPEGMVGPMFGGNLASAMTGPKGAITYRIHDRFETPAQYEANSH